MADDRVELDRRARHALGRVTAAAHLAAGGHARRTGLALHSTDAVVLELLRVHGPLTPRDLARLAEVTSSGTITGAIDRLEGAGWTTRTPCQVDRRKVFVTLTEAGEAPVPDEVADAIDGCTDDQLATVVTVLEAMSPR